MIRRNELYTIHVRQSGANKWCLTAVIHPLVEEPVKAASAVYREIASVLFQTNAEIVQERIFASAQLHPTLKAARNRVLRDVEAGNLHPITFIHGCPPWGGGFAGVQICAVTAAPPIERVWTLFDDDGPCGRAWSSLGSTFLALQNLRSPSPAAKQLPEDQLQQMLDRARRLLQRFGGPDHDVLRAWYYLPEGFPRTDEFGRLPKSCREPWSGSGCQALPVASCICTNGSPEESCAMDLLAVIPSQGSMQAFQPLAAVQACEAGVKAVAHGVEFGGGSGETIHFAASASLDQSANRNMDAGDSIQLCFNRIETLLAPAGIGLCQVRAAAITVGRPNDWAACCRVLSDRGLDDFPALPILSNTRCEELLIEIDGIASSCAVPPS